jgi:hypothetical protein
VQFGSSETWGARFSDGNAPCWLTLFLRFQGAARPDGGNGRSALALSAISQGTPMDRGHSVWLADIHDYLCEHISVVRANLERSATQDGTENPTRPQAASARS